MNKYKLMRHKSEMTQQTVSNILGVAQSTVSMWEIGESLPRTEMLLKIASLYNCTVDDLLGKDNKDYVNTKQKGGDT